MTLKIIILIATASVLSACSPTKQPPVSDAKNAKPKICVKNGTHQPFYFGVAQESFGTLTSQLEPNARFCTVTEGTPDVFIRQDKKSKNLCQTQGEAGLQFTLVDTSDCSWKREPQ